LCFGHKNAQVLGRNFDARTFVGENLVLAESTTKILLPDRILAGILEEFFFFLGGMLAWTDFPAGFLPRCAAEILPRKDLTVKTGLLSGISA